MWSMRFDCILVTDGASDISASSSSDRQTSTAGGDEDRMSGEEVSSDPSEAESGISITSAAAARGRDTFSRLVDVAATITSSAFAAFLVAWRLALGFTLGLDLVVEAAAGLPASLRGRPRGRFGDGAGG
ncbi:hypothetical protein HYQ46_001541 [Verticillium longisporum]|nr:hypothetical protein HYQ46_001541 [Verticillium longisporum]